MEPSPTVDLALNSPDLGSIHPPSPQRMAGLRRRALAAAGLAFLYVPTLLLLLAGAMFGAIDPESLLWVLVDVAVALVSFFAFLYWFAGAYRFAQDVSPYPLESTPGWSVGSYFIPIMNLFVPYKRMREVEEASSLSARGLDLNESFDGRLVTLWWTLWVLGGIVGALVGGWEGLSPEAGASWAPSIIMVAVSVAGSALTGLVALQMDGEQQEMGAYLLDQQPLAPEAHV